MHCFFIHFGLLAQYREGVTSDGRELLKKFADGFPVTRIFDCFPSGALVRPMPQSWTNMATPCAFSSAF